MPPHTPALEGTPVAPAAAAAVPENAAPAAVATAGSVGAPLPLPPPASTAHPHAAPAPPPRIPSIHFPPRRTVAGEVISSLPAAAQAAARAALAPGGSGRAMPAAGAGAAAAAQTLPPLSQRLRGLDSSDTKWYAGKERGVKLTASQALSEAEIELIQLGGAV
jgi:hypothetical protein